MSVTKEELDKYIKAYSQGSPLISDEEYDELLEEYLKEHGGESARPFMRQSQSSSVNDVVGTLGKVYGVTVPMRPDMPVYTDWVNKHQVSDNVCVQPKFDGISIAYDVETERFFTRGDYDNGESVDVTDLFRLNAPIIHDMILKNYDKALAVKFEAILDVDTYKSYFADNYKRPRDVVAAAVTRRDKEMCMVIRLIPLRVYTEHGYQHIPELLMGVSNVLNKTDYDSIQNFVDNLLENQAHVTIGLKEFECDGVVVSSTKHIDVDDIVTDPSTEVAIKILNYVQETKLKDVVWQFGKSGRITPVAVVEPTMFGNVVVTNVGLSNMNRIHNLGLRYNDTVSIMYNIVPYLVDSKHDGDMLIPLPDTCPECGCKLNMGTLKTVTCDNPDCRGNKIGGIVRYCEKIKAFGISSGVITRLYDAGYLTRISDLYTKDFSDTVNLSGFGNKSIENMLKSIQSASTNIPVYRWLGAFPGKQISTKTWKNVIEMIFGINNAHTNDYVMEMLKNDDTPDRFVRMIDNCLRTPITSKAMEMCLRNNWDDMKIVSKYVTFKPIDIVFSTGKYVCLSGTRDKAVIKKLESLGYTVVDSWRNDVIALVIPRETYQSTKVAKAQNLGRAIYTVDQVMNEGALDLS